MITSLRALNISGLMRFTRPPPPALNRALELLREHKYQSADHNLRQLAETSYALPPGRNFSEMDPAKPLSIAGLGARISLANHEMETAAGFAKFIEAQSDAQQMSDVTLEVVAGFMQCHLRNRLACVASILTSTPPAKISPALVERFYEACMVDPPAHLIHQVWSHCKVLPKPGGIVSLLKFLVRGGQHPGAIRLINQLLEGHDSDSEYLPARIPIYLASELLTYGIQTGATEQCLRIYDQASRLVGAPLSLEQRDLSYPIIDQSRIYGEPEMALVFVRHFVRLSGKRRNQLQGWHRTIFDENPRFFLETAERVYATYAAVNGFEKFDSEDYKPEPGTLHPDRLTATAIACLFELDRSAAALNMFSALFDRTLEYHEQFMDNPDMYHLGIILPSLARRDPDRAVQILTETAPARLTGFRPNRHFYTIVLHQLIQTRKLDGAFRLLEYASRIGYENSNPKMLEAFIQASISDIICSWGSSDDPHMTPDEVEVMATKKLRTFNHILGVLRLLELRANVHTVHTAIEVALIDGNPRVACEIRVWGDRVWLFRLQDASILGDGEGQRKGPVEEWKSSPRSIARALLCLHRRGLMEEAELGTRLDQLGISRDFINTEEEPMENSASPFIPVRDTV